MIRAISMHTPIFLELAVPSPIVAQTSSDLSVIVAILVVLTLIAVTAVLLYLAFGFDTAVGAVGDAEFGSTESTSDDSEDGLGESTDHTG